MELYVVRHGQTDGNLNNLMDGVRDIDLNETGISQARQTKKQIEDLTFDLIICSPLLRTKHTMEIINTHNFPVLYDKNLQERDCGEFTGKSIYSIDKAQYWNYFDKNKYKSAESVKQFFDRVFKFLENLKKSYATKKILLVTHFGVTKAIQCYFNGIPQNGDLQNLGLQNCEIAKYDL